MANPINTTVKTNLGNLEPLRYTFTFTLDNFRITDTRSRHNDTDFVSFTLLVKGSDGSGTPQTLTKSMGDVNNGTHNVGLSFNNISVSAGQTVVLNYLIVNSGHKSESEVYSVLEKAGGALATKGLTALGGAIGTAIPIPLLGTLLGAGAGWLVGELSSIASADCDGPVAAEQDTFSYNDLLTRTANGNFSQDTPHPGSNSPTGCGSNSMYYVTWHMAKQEVLLQKAPVTGVAVAHTA